MPHACRMAVRSSSRSYAPISAKPSQIDLQLLITLARWLERLWPESRRLHPVQVVEDYQLTLTDELDLMKEAANTSQLRRNFPPVH